MTTSGVSDKSIKAAMDNVKANKRRGRLPIDENERAARLEAEQAEKARRVEAKRLKKEAKLASRPERGPVHLKKVEKARERLPKISTEAAAKVDELINTFDRNEITGVMAHVGHRLREKATIDAQTATLIEGQLVRINATSSRFDGQLGRVKKVQRIRCYVEILSAPGRVEYLFNSDVDLVKEDETTSVDEASSTSEESLAAVG